MKMRCIALDDEPLALLQITGYIRRTGFLELAGAFRNASEALEWLGNDSADLIFADINMPGSNGLDFVRSLKERPQVIFTTAYDEYALEGFRVDATDYLLKPIGYGDFLRSAERAYSRFSLLKGEPKPSGSPETIFVKSGYKVVPIEVDKILYIESRSEYVRIFTETARPVMTLGSLKSYESRLPFPPFMRVHRSYIVNLHKISSAGRRIVSFADGKNIPVGESYLERFRKYFADW